jgi:hypothetical protein
MHDSAITPIIHRYGFTPPPIYRSMRADGCFDPHHPHHLQLADLTWMTPTQIG